MDKQPDLNNLTYWHPRLEAAGLPVPRTIVVDAGPEWRELYALLDCQTPPLAERVAAGIQAAALELSLPVFLRTGHTSGKHEWERTCCLVSAEREAVLDHLHALVEWSELVGWGALPCNTWAVREWLPGPVEFVSPRFHGMPVRREYRCFVRDAAVVCVHPYWPAEAFAARLSREQAAEFGVPYDGLSEPEEARLAGISGPEPGEVRELASRAGAALGGAWSVDLLCTDRGWYVTDAALASDSWHWPGCPHEATFA